MNTIVFQRPEYLWVFPIAVALIVAWRLLRRRHFVAFPLERLLAPRMYHASRLRHAPTIIAVAALPFVALALTDPVLPYSEGQVKSRGIDIVLVLDLSSSMQEPMSAQRPTTTPTNMRASTGAPKVVGDTRLSITKKALIEFVNRRPDDRIGLIVFSERAYLVSPMTLDHAYLRDYVSMIDGQTLRKEGMTAIGDGIALASALLARQSTTRVAGQKVVIVFTDGEYNVGSDPVEMLAAANQAGTRVHMVGIDFNEGVKRRPEVLRLVEAVRRYGGRYFSADTAGQLQQASLTIDGLEKSWLVQTRYTRNRSVYHYFVFPAILLLTGALFLRAVPYFIDVT